MGVLCVAEVPGLTSTDATRGLLMSEICWG